MFTHAHVKVIKTELHQASASSGQSAGNTRGRGTHRVAPRRHSRQHPDCGKLCRPKGPGPPIDNCKKIKGGGKTTDKNDIFKNEQD